MSPRVAIQQADDGELQLLVQPLQQPAAAARGLARAVGEDAVVLILELVIVEEVQDSAILHVEDELGFELPEMDEVPLYDVR